MMQNSGFQNAFAGFVIDNLCSSPNTHAYRKIFFIKMYNITSIF